MIDKILDRYYFKKLKNKIEKYMLLMHSLSYDYYVEYSNNHLYLYIKKVKYTNYIRLLTIDEDWILSNLVNFRKLANLIDKYIELYAEENNG